MARLKNCFDKRRYFYVFIAPWMAGFLLLTMVPMFLSLGLSFGKWDFIGTYKFVGFSNFIDIFTNDPKFYKSLLATLQYTVYFPVTLLLGLLAAILLNNKMKGVAVFRAILYSPVIVPAVASSMLWMWIFSPGNGLLNMLLKSVHLPPGKWLSGESTAVISIALMSLWSFGSSMLVMLGALQGVPRQLYEAAELEGIGKFNKAIHITLPMISPMLFYQFIMCMIVALQVFSQAKLMTNGGPNDSTLFIVLYIYNKAFVDYDMGYASALSWVLFAVILLLTMLTFKLGQKKVYYEGD